MKVSYTGLKKVDNPVLLSLIDVVIHNHVIELVEAFTPHLAF